jgi:peptidoglycan-N-acetylglucosamine deacetylase
MSETPDVFLTVDAEPDCPPYLWTWRGIDEAAPRLLDLLAEEGIPATFFTTGNVAWRSPWFVERLLDEGHELGCHGMTHRAFPTLDEATARWEIDESARILREHAPVSSFRAPYLRLPSRYVPLLEDAGFTIDASLASYKPRPRGDSKRSIMRVETSITSSALRLPRPIRDRWLARLPNPIVLFVHPWEFIDLTRSRVRWDCRVRTGDAALTSLRETLRYFSSRGARFRRISDLVSTPYVAGR